MCFRNTRSTALFLMWVGEVWLCVAQLTHAELCGCVMDGIGCVWNFAVVGMCMLCPVCSRLCDLPVLSIVG